MLEFEDPPENLLSGFFKEDLMKIVVLCGGTSTEREISIISGTGVCKALRQNGHMAILVDAFFGCEDSDLMDAFPDYYDVDEAAAYIRSFDSKVESAKANPTRSFFGPNVLKLCRMSDLVFLTLHGANGEDGKVQAAFDLRKIRYTGTGYASSALSMDKGLTKIMLGAKGIPVPKGTTLQKGLDSVDLHDMGLSFPLVVKVACGGSSVGVYIVNDYEEYLHSLDLAFELEDEVLVEEFIRGREFSVGVIDGQALPVIEIRPKSGFYDYKSKYTAGMTDEICPAEISEPLTRKMQHYAEACYHALFMEAYARFDFIMREDGEMYCLEANTLPGMTPMSLMPQEAAAIGMDYPAFCEKIIEVSLAKYKKK